MINIYDGNNYYRKTLETDITGFAPRGILNEMLAPKDVTIWCWDGSNGNAKRREIYPEYKRNRGPVKKDIYAGFDQLKEILKHTAVYQVEVPGYEADDVIAALARRHADQKIAIYSNDYDFSQLHAEFPDSIFTGAKRKASVPDHLVKHYKTLVGDPSDNIPGIKGFGEKAWEALGEGVAEYLISDLVTFDTFEKDGLTPAVINWLNVPDNREMIRKFWTIIGFIDVPLELINEHTIKGVPDFAKADAILKEFML